MNEDFELENEQIEQKCEYPKISIDADALRFEFEDSGTNIFWDAFFVGQTSPNYQAQIMRLIHKAYIECIKSKPPLTKQV